MGKGMQFCLSARTGERERDRASAGNIYHQAVGANSDAEYVHDTDTFSPCSSLVYSVSDAACTCDGTLCTVYQLTHSTVLSPC